jgi:hypothetical protein
MHQTRPNGVFGWALGRELFLLAKSKKLTKWVKIQKLLFHKQLFWVCSIVLKAPWALFFTFGFLFFKMMKIIENCFTVVSRKIKK